MNVLASVAAATDSQSQNLPTIPENLQVDDENEDFTQTQNQIPFPLNQKEALLTGTNKSSVEHTCISTKRFFSIHL